MPRRMYLLDLCIIVHTAVLFVSTSGRMPDQITEHEIVSFSSVESVAGGIAHLPCDIVPPVSGDKLLLVIWYKETDSSPIYSIDARRKSVDHAVHNANKVFKDRAVFRLNDSPTRLTLSSISEGDAGAYRCRVDFKRSPTRNSKVNLTVILPPEKLLILDGNGVKVQSHILGPYNEGTSVNVTCISMGGRPLPRVTWWQGNTLLDDTFETVSKRRVRNVLHLDNLQRHQLNAVLTCQASNNDHTTPISTTVLIDLNLKPSEVKIQDKGRPLSSGKSYNISCSVSGSSPAPVITWWKAGVSIYETKGENTTVSTLEFTPSVTDSGKYLTCRGENSLFTDSILEDSWKLNVYHSPIPVLEIGRNLKTSTVTEGEDVYFECNIKSNPWLERVIWKHNGKELQNNLRGGILMNNESLVLQEVTNNHEGNYTCVATNQEGSGESNSVYLDVMYAPVCKSSKPEYVGVSLGEPINVICDVEANPDILQYSWSFRNSTSQEDTLITMDQPSNILTYTPLGYHDFGSLLCTASNHLGSQRLPCVYTLVLAGKPEGVKNCLILNETTSSFYVTCDEGFDGGLKQEFLMEVYEIMSRPVLIKNITSRVSEFHVTGLNAAHTFDLRIYAVNKKGHSEPLYVHAQTLSYQKKSFLPFLGEEAAVFQLTQLIGIVLVAVTSFIILALSVLVALIIVSGRNKQLKNRTGSAERLESHNERNPDVIPNINDKNKSTNEDSLRVHSGEK